MRIPKYHTARSRARSSPKTHHAVLQVKTTFGINPTKKQSYKSSRVVELTTPTKSKILPPRKLNSIANVNTMKKSHAMLKPKRHSSRRGSFSRSKCGCPDAPYNTTSYIIDLHRSEDSQETDNIFPHVVPTEGEYDDLLFDFNIDCNSFGFVLRGAHDCYSVDDDWDQCHSTVSN